MFGLDLFCRRILFFFTALTYLLVFSLLEEGSLRPFTCTVPVLFFYFGLMDKGMSAPPRMYLCTVKLLLLYVVVELVITGGWALLCLRCDESKCEEPKNCTGSIVLGICGCCYVCARQKNETCGGVYGLYGTCDRGLRCVIRPPPLNGDSITVYEVGLCEDENWDDDDRLGYEPCNENLIAGCNIINGKCECDTIRTCSNPFEFPSQEACQFALKRIEEEKPDCSKARCEVQFSPRCPEDSILIEGYAPPGECCPLPSRCVCNPAGCLRKVCQPGYLNIMVSKASGKPGECCDTYECKPVFSVDCSTVECPSVQQVTCPADSYETQVRLTADGCCALPTRCECIPEICRVPNCEAGTVPRIVSHGDGTPGKCCDTYECVSELKPACIFNGVEYHDGDMFRMDACRFCRCQGGVSICFMAQCGELNCDRYYVPEGECCPVCEDPVHPVHNAAGCYASGQIRAHGDRWREDDCTFCQCINGDPHCVATACGQSCLNPVKVPGECCPVCEEPSYMTIAPPICDTLGNCTLTEWDCLYGFKLNANGCRTCQCKTKDELCTSLILGCSLDCPLGFQTDVHGCEMCQCRPRPKKCRPVVCEKHCPLGYMKNKHGCDICRCKKCLDLSCNNTCPVGFKQDSHGCPTCKCRDDTGVRTPELSNPSVCHAPGGEYFVEGETWNIDSCTQCTCNSGRVLCETEVCPPLLCQNPVRSQDSCCPQCPDEPLKPQSPSNESTPGYCKNEDGDIFLAAESWKPNVCTSCICMDGTISCFSESCPPVACERPVLRKGQCCPYCIEDTLPKKVVCHFNGKTYADEERWDIDRCTHCYCLQGQTLCSTVSCPVLPCSDHISDEGSCCPICPEMYVPEPTNIPIEKTDRRGENDPGLPFWPTPGENDIAPQLREMNNLKVEYRGGDIPLYREDSSFSNIAWVIVPIIIALVLLVALLFINRRKKWIPVPCYSAPTKPTCLNNQLVYVDCKKGTMVHIDSSQRMLRIADPDSRYSGFYSMQKQNSLQADSFYQTV
ncbi:cysteine-rich motor neuron 1 protein isoform X2 [Protopterus annectens]|uniref:cysteine-rich motor neuron 1 protein isoform X2 n=1 Tax=Protopterus annectens TaxID=7888 RepID=UPI001CFBE26B|nr:cysteine-rich motor neuron 1 protein isoform X2 [Protopterus annectens]